MTQKIIWTGHSMAKRQIFPENAPPKHLSWKWDINKKHLIEKCTAENFRHGSMYFLYNDYLNVKKDITKRLKALLK